jgi:hypothetical protein
VLAQAACGPSYDSICDVNDACKVAPDSGTSTTSSSGALPDGGPIADGGPDAPAPGPCAGGKSPVDDATCVTDEKVVFVNPTSPKNGTGTKASPYGSIKDAISGRGSKGIVVCEGTYPEQLTLSGTVQLYGGFNCGSWAHEAKATPSTLIKSGTSLGLKIEKDAKVTLESLGVNDHQDPEES